MIKRIHIVGFLLFLGLLACFSFTSPGKSRTALYLESLGMKEVKAADSNILVRLMYATPHNFTGKVLYRDLKEAYLHPLALRSLVKAQRLLQAKHPGYHLVVCDAARPMSVQKEMFDKVKGTRNSIYVSNPKHGGGLHNYGMAVDITIADAQGRELPMGTHVDYFGSKAHINHETLLLKKGLITKEELANRRLLREVMTRVGFKPLRTEWWHFNRCTRKQAKHHYHIIP